MAVRRLPPGSRWPQSPRGFAGHRRARASSEAAAWTTVAHSTVASVRWATISAGCSPSHTFSAPSRICRASSAGASRNGSQPAARGGVTRPTPERHRGHRHDRDRGQVHEQPVGQVDVHQPPVLEGHEPVQAGGELLAAGEVSAEHRLVRRPLALGPGDVATRDDRPEQQHRGHRGCHPQGTGALQGRASCPRDGRCGAARSAGRAAASPAPGGRRPAPSEGRARRSGRRAPPGREPGGRRRPSRAPASGGRAGAAAPGGRAPRSAPPRSLPRPCG